MDLRVNKMQDNFKNIAIISILLVVISINNYGTVLEYLLRTLNPTNQNAKKKLYAVVRIEELYDCPTSRLRGIVKTWLLLLLLLFPTRSFLFLIGSG